MSIAIELEDVSKRYRREWVIRNANISLAPNGKYGLTGPNGAGKSTLMRIISGHLSPSRGKCTFFKDERPLPGSEIYRDLTFAAPYIDLIEEFTLEEALQFQLRFKPWLPGLEIEELHQILGFAKARNKQIRHFSSGMKQRLKLLMAIAADSNLLLLDEPTTNLDKQGIAWYLELMERFVASHPRLLIVASNVEEDFAFCKERINVMDFKGKKREN